MQDFKKNNGAVPRGGNIFLCITFGVMFMISLGTILEREYSTTAKMSAVVENVGEGAVPIVYAEWGGRDCVRIEKGASSPSCTSPEGMKILSGGYEVVWVPYPSQKVVGR